MKRKTVTIREDQEEWIQNRHLKLSSFIRNQIDKSIEETEIPFDGIDFSEVTLTPNEPEPALVDDDSRVAFRGGQNSAILLPSRIREVDIIQSDRDSVVYIPTLSTESCIGDALADHFAEAVSQLGLRVDPQYFAYIFQCDDFGWYGTGAKEFDIDAGSPWETAESLKQQINDGDKNLRLGQPVFGAIAECDIGLFWASVKVKEKEDSGFPGYEAECGIIVEAPLLACGKLSDFVVSDEEPVFQKKCDYRWTSLPLDQHTLEGVQPVAMSEATAHTIGAANPLHGQDLFPGNDPIEAAVTAPSRLPWRTMPRSGTSDKDAFAASALDVTQFKIPAVSGISPVFVNARCVPQST